MFKTRTILRLILCVILAVSVCSLIAMRLDIAKKDSELAEKQEEINNQKLRNNEMSSMLDEKNIEDFYRDIAENELDYGLNNEKIYIDISGH